MDKRTHPELYRSALTLPHPVPRMSRGSCRQQGCGMVLTDSATGSIRTTCSTSSPSSPESDFMTPRKERGFSLLEMLITLAIGLIMAGFTFIVLMPLLRQSHVDAAYDTTLSVIRNYRNQSITQSKRYILTFSAPGTITVQYWGVGVPVSPAPVTVATFSLPNDIQF